VPVSEVVSNATTLSQANPAASGVQTERKGTRRFCEIVEEQGRALEESCERQALRDTLVAAGWHRVNMWLGISSAVLSTLVAFAVGHNDFIKNIIQHVPKFAAETDAAGAADALKALLSLFSVGLVSVLTFLVPSEKSGDLGPTGMRL
jgi:hypothetical protein